MSLKEKMIVNVLSTVDASFKEPNSSTRSALLDFKMPEGSDSKDLSVSADLNVFGGEKFVGEGVSSMEEVSPAIDQKAKYAHLIIEHGSGSSAMSEAGPSVGGFFSKELPLVGDGQHKGSISTTESDSEMSEGESSSSGDSLFQRRVALARRSSSALHASDFNPAYRTKRAYRNALERKRRRLIKEGFENLYQSVSGLEEDGSRTSNMEMLKRTASFIHFMNRKIEKGRQQITTLLRRNALLRKQIEILEEQKAARKSARKSVAAQKKNDARDNASSFDLDDSPK